MHDRPEKIPARQNRRSARAATPTTPRDPDDPRVLGELVESLARYLVDFRIRATAVEVEVLHGARRMRFCREVPEGEHDLVALAVLTLQDASDVIGSFIDPVEPAP